MMPFAAMRMKQASGGGGGDPYWANVVALLHMDGTNGGTTFTDEKGKTWTPSSCTTTMGTVKFGSASANFGGAGFLSTASSTDFGFGFGDFTIEFWIWTASASSFQYVFMGRGGTGTPNANNGVLESGYFKWSDAYSYSISSMLLPLSQWVHIAICRVGGVLKIFQNGVQVFSATNSIDIGGSRPFYIGKAISGLPYYLTAYIDEVRITKGVGRYASDFTPPTAPFPSY